MRFRLGLPALSIVLVGCGGKVAVDGATDGATTAPTCAGVDLHTDPHHCGWCGHDCGGATCSNSVCAPTTIAGGLDLASSIALDDGYVYWTSTGLVRRARKGGGDEKTYYSGDGREYPGSGVVRNVAVDRERVYWLRSTPTSGSAGEYLPKEDGAPSGALELAGSGVTDAMTACDDGVWYNDTYALAHLRITPPEFSIFDIGARTLDLACDGSTVVWLDGGPGVDVESGTGRVVRFSSVAGIPERVLADSLARPAQITTDADTAYFTSGRYTGLIQSVPLKGGPTTTIASGQLDPQGIAVDDRYVYWVNVGQLPAEGTVMRADKKLGTPQFLAFGQRRPLAIAVDDRYVYWVSQGDAGKANGGVYRVPK
jgi:hypothetical protein